MSVDDAVLISLWVHVPLATAWIGLVMFDVFAAAAPGLSSIQRGQMIAWSRGLVVAAIVVLMVTGIWQTMHNPISEVRSYSELASLRDRTAYGMALFLKHGFVIATFVLTVIVRFVLAPRLVAAGASGGMAVAGERQILWLSILNLAACLGALVMATRMIYSLH